VGIPGRSTVAVATSTVVTRSTSTIERSTASIIRLLTATWWERLRDLLASLRP
jgi:hypothetical protein